MRVDGNSRRTATLAVALLLLIVAVVAGCGSGSSTTDASAASSAGSPSEFTRPGDKTTNAYAVFGHEASNEERQAAYLVLKRDYKARAHGAWKTQCSTLSSKLITQVFEATGVSGVEKTCPNALSILARPLASTKKVRVNTLAGSIAVLRVKGRKAYAFYHGTKDKDYVMPMENVNQQWKVAALLEEPIG